MSAGYLTKADPDFGWEFKAEDFVFVGGVQDGPDGPTWWSRDMLRIAEHGGFRNDFLAKQAQEQTSPSKGDQVT
ncbi:hypothetical protein ACWCQM_11560 [Streptomyces sp. NPDC002125]